MTNKMAKEYVLVPTEVYNRKFGQNAMPNPFANPNIKRAKENRMKMTNVATDSSIPPEEANLLMRNLLASYRREVGNVLKPNRSAIPKIGAPMPPQPTADNQRSETSRARPSKPVKLKTGAASKTKKKTQPPSAEDIKRTRDFMGGVLNSDDAIKAASLLKEMMRAGMLGSDWKKGATLPGGKKLRGAQLKRIVRDAYVNSPDKRGLPPGPLESFSQTLSAEGIDTDHAPRKKRKTDRLVSHGRRSQDI